MAKLKPTEAPTFTSTAAATLANHCVRKGEHDSDISGRAAALHSHGYSDVVGLEDFVRDTVSELSPLAILLKSGGGLAEDVEGLSVTFGSGNDEAARGNHTHEALHAAATGSGTSSVAIALNGQEISASVRLKPAGALDVDDDGLFVSFGSGPDDAAPGNHTHPASNITVLSSTSVALTIEGQQISAAARLKTALGAAEGGIGADSGGIFVALGSSEGQAAAGNHEHPLATQAAHGFMAASDKLKLDQYQELFQADHPVSYCRADRVPSGQYVGGRYRWAQEMAVLSATVIASAPVGGNVVLALEVDGVQTGDTLIIPAGASGAEVANTASFTNLFVASGEYARWHCISSTSSLEDSASAIHLSMNVRPALGTIPEKRINCGGGAVAPFGVDQHFSGGGAGGPSVNPIDLSAVTDPAPMAVYQTVRGRYFEAAWITYTIPGLARGIEYVVRLHFAEMLWTEAGQQIFHISIEGATTAEFLSHDTLALTAGIQNKAVIREATLKADEDGQITITLKPQPNSTGFFHSAINAIEIVRW